MDAYKARKIPANLPYDPAQFYDPRYRKKRK
jgi:hypothetical protein